MDPSGTLILESSGNMDIGRITYILAGPYEEEQLLVVSCAEEFIEWLEEFRDANDRIVFFEFVGHCVTTAKKDEPRIGLVFGDDVFGIGQTMKDWDAKPGGSTGHTWYGIEDYRSLLTAAFDPSGVIELEGCHSADGITSTGYAFKKHLPSASVWGYTGDCQYFFPFIPIMWETREHLLDPDSESVEIFL